MGSSMDKCVLLSVIVISMEWNVATIIFMQIILLSDGDGHEVYVRTIQLVLFDCGHWLSWLIIYCIELYCIVVF